MLSIGATAVREPMGLRPICRKAAGRVFAARAVRAPFHFPTRTVRKPPEAAALVTTEPSRTGEKPPIRTRPVYSRKNTAERKTTMTRIVRRSRKLRPADLQAPERMSDLVVPMLCGILSRQSLSRRREGKRAAATFGKAELSA
jgi:hypothetical protein